MHTTTPRADAPRHSSWWRHASLLFVAAWVIGCASLPANSGRSPSNAFNAPDATPLGQLVQARRAQAGARSDSGFYLLDSVDAAFTSRLALIEGAQRSLDLQYYAIHADASTEILLQRLRDAARRGVKVRLLLDDFNTVGQDAQVLLLQFEPNVEIRLFNPLTGSRSSLLSRVLGSLHDAGRIQKRMHNKLFLADNALGIAGGRNLGDAYFGSGEKSNFVDLDVLAWGRIVRDMSASFDRYWNDELAYPVQTLLSPQDLAMLRKKAAEQAPAAADPSRVGVPQQAPAAPVTVPGTASATVLPDVTMTTAQAQERAPMDLRRVTLTWAPSRLMVDKPDKIGPDEDEADASDTVVDGLLALMLQARQDILIISPYFVPGAEMMKTFAQARARGVRIRVLTNSLASNDAPAAHAGYARYRRDLLGLGIELHEMRATEQTAGGLSGSGSGRRGLWLGSSGGGSKAGASRASLHSKAVIIDGRLAIIGSMNLDLRSKNLNSEVALLIRSAALSREATRLVESTFAQGAYRVELAGDKLLWRAPPGAGYPDASDEPEAGTRLKLLVKLLGPLAPDEIL